MSYANDYKTKYRQKSPQKLNDATITHTINTPQPLTPISLKMRFTIQTLLILLFIVVVPVQGEIAAGGGGGGTAANTFPSLTSSETAPDTSISGIKGINPDTSATTKASELEPSGPTATSTVTNGGGGGGGTFTQTTTFQSGAVASGSVSAGAVSSSGCSARNIGGFGGGLWGVLGLAVCGVMGVIGLV